jgi:hypothetical protein
MAKALEEYIAEGDLEGYIKEVEGLNLVYRGQMLKALRSDDNEMVKLGEVFAEAYNRQVKEDIRLMSPAFLAGFMPLFIMNGGKIEQLSA